MVKTTSNIRIKASNTSLCILFIKKSNPYQQSLRKTFSGSFLVYFRFLISFLIQTNTFNDISVCRSKFRIFRHENYHINTINRLCRIWISLISPINDFCFFLTKFIKKFVKVSIFNLGKIVILHYLSLLQLFQ